MSRALLLAAAMLLTSAAAPVDLARIDTALAAGRPEVARALLERAGTAGQSGPEFELRLAEFWLADDARGQARGAFAKLAAEPGPLQARALQGLAVAALQAGDTTAAETAAKAATALDPALARAWNVAAVVADKRDDWPAAEAAYAAALAAAPGSAITLANRCMSRLLQRRADDAAADCTAALRRDPLLTEARSNLRLAHALGGNYTAAFAGVGKKDMGAALNTIGYGAMLRGDRAAAESYFTRAMTASATFNRAAWANLNYLKTLPPAAAPGR